MTIRDEAPLTFEFGNNTWLTWEYYRDNEALSESWTEECAREGLTRTQAVERIVGNIRDDLADAFRDGVLSTQNPATSAVLLQDPDLMDIDYRQVAVRIVHAFWPEGSASPRRASRPKAPASKANKPKAKAPSKRPTTKPKSKGGRR